MANLNKTLLSELKSVGITGVKTEDDAKKKLVAFLAENDVDNVEDEDLKSLIEMADAFYEGDAPEESTSSETETEADDLAEEVEGEEEEPVEEEEVVEEEEEIVEEEEEDEFEGMDRDELKKYIGANKFHKGDDPIKIKKSDSDDDIRGFIRGKVGEPEKAAPKKEIDKKPPKKDTSKTTSAPAATSESGGTRLPIFDARNDESHEKHIQVFIDKFFPAEEFEIKILKQGFTVRLLGKNAKPTIMNFDELKIDDGSLFGNLYLNRLKTVDEMMEFLPERLKDNKIGHFRGETHPSIKRVTTDDVIEILEANGALAASLQKADATDERLGKNREKMEEQLANDGEEELLEEE